LAYASAINQLIKQRKISRLMPSKNMIIKYFKENKDFLNAYLENNNIIFLIMTRRLKNELEQITDKKFEKIYNELKIYISDNNKNYMFYKFKNIIEQIISSYNETKYITFYTLFNIIIQYIQNNIKAINNFSNMLDDFDDIILECFE
jgi:hypothetical protein